MKIYFGYTAQANTEYGGEWAELHLFDTEKSAHKAHNNDVSYSKQQRKIDIANGQTGHDVVSPVTLPTTWDVLEIVKFQNDFPNRTVYWNTADTQTYRRVYEILKVLNS